MGKTHSRPPPQLPRQSSGGERALRVLDALPRDSRRGADFRDAGGPRDTKHGGSVALLTRVPWLMMLTYCDGVSISRLGGCSSWFFERTRAHESSGIWRYLLRRDFGRAGSGVTAQAASSSVAALMHAQVLPALLEAGRACPRCTLVQRTPPLDVLAATKGRGILGLEWVDRATQRELGPYIWTCEVCRLPLEELEDARARMKLALVGIDRPAEGANKLAVGIDRLIDVAFIAMPILQRLRSDGSTPVDDDPLAPVRRRGTRFMTPRRGDLERQRGARMARVVGTRDLSSLSRSRGGWSGSDDRAGGAADGSAAAGAAAVDATLVNEAQPFYAMYFAVAELFARGEQVESAARRERLRYSRWKAWRGVLAESLAVSALFPITIVVHSLIVGVVLWWWAWAPAAPCAHVCAADNGTCAADYARACVAARSASEPLLPLPIAVAPFVACVALYGVALCGGAAHALIVSYIERTRVEDAARGDDAIFVVPRRFPEKSLRNLCAASATRGRTLPFRRLRKPDALDEVIFCFSVYSTASQSSPSSSSRGESLGVRWAKCASGRVALFTRDARAVLTTALAAPPRSARATRPTQHLLKGEDSLQWFPQHALKWCLVACWSRASARVRLRHRRWMCATRGLDAWCRRDATRRAMLTRVGLSSTPSGVDDFNRERYPIQQRERRTKKRQRQGFARKPWQSNGYVLSREEHAVPFVAFALWAPLLAAEVLCTLALVHLGFDDAAIPAWTRPVAHLSKNVIFGAPSEISWQYLINLGLIALTLGMLMVLAQDADARCSNTRQNPRRTATVRSAVAKAWRYGMPLRTTMLLALYSLISPTRRPALPALSWLATLALLAHAVAASVFQFFQLRHLSAAGVNWGKTRRVSAYAGAAMSAAIVALHEHLPLTPLSERWVGLFGWFGVVLVTLWFIAASVLGGAFVLSEDLQRWGRHALDAARLPLVSRRVVALPLAALALAMFVKVSFFYLPLHCTRILLTV